MVISGQASEWASVTSGVPQGSILGPLLFLLYVNDIGEEIHSHARLFADDCTLFREVSTSSHMEALQNDLHRLYEWSQKWQLNLNLTKCKAICISNKCSPPFHKYAINVFLDWVDTFKYLGVTVGCNLKWKDQVLTSAAKETKVLNLLRRNMFHCSKKAQKRAFLALVRPLLEYAAPVWSPYHLKYVNALEKVQKRAARWICATWNRSTYPWTISYEECCSKLKWLSLKARRDYLSCCQVFKIIHHLDCINFSNYFSFSPLSSTSCHSLALFCRQSRVNAFRYSFFVRAVFLWNSLPTDVVTANSYNTFKRRYYRILF